VKEVQVTQEYIGLGEDITKCQNRESFEECTTKSYIDSVQKNCYCIPYALKYLLNATLVRINFESIQFYLIK